jgi:hypothetical protein
MKKILPFIIILSLLCSCKENSNTLIKFIEGNWEIHQVKKDNQLLKEYDLNQSIDYFQVNDDLSGFRKKLMPNLDGKYIVTEHEAPFQLHVENGKLNIKYYLGSDTIVETIRKASEMELIIQNNRGFTYFYKRFEPFNIADE